MPSILQTYASLPILRRQVHPRGSTISSILHRYMHILCIILLTPKQLEHFLKVPLTY
jgi:hypothetical protein